VLAALVTYRELLLCPVERLRADDDFGDLCEGWAFMCPVYQLVDNICITFGFKFDIAIG